MKGRKNLNTMLSERHELNKIALSELKKDVEKTRQFSSYFSKMADLLLFLNEIYDTKEKSLEQLKQWNKIWYEEVSPEKYVDSLGNPAFCVQEYGKDYGQIFSFLYTEMRSGFIYAIEGRLFDLVINNELFLEISNLFLAGEEHPQQIKNIIFDHMRDYSEDVYEYRVREQLDPELNFATKIVMESDLSNTLLNHEFTVIDDERLKVYREEGWELHENMAAADAGMNTELIEKGRALCEEEREIIWAMQLDGLTETQACEEYFLTKHTEYNNFSICYIPNKEVFAECVAVFGERY